MRLDSVDRNTAIALRRVARTAFLLGLLGGVPRSIATAAARDMPPTVPVAAVNGDVYALVRVGNVGLQFVAGGDFSLVDAVPVHNVVQWTPAGWSLMGDGFDAPVRALAILDGAVVAAGDFEHSGSVAVRHLARWNGAAWEPLGAGTDGPVHALLVQAGVILYAGGAFTQAGGVEAHGIARWVGNTWSALGLGFQGSVEALALFNGSLVAGGTFTMRDPGSPGQNLARFAAGVWRTPALGLDGPIQALAVYRGALVMAGRFANADLVTPARHVAALISEWNSVGFGIGTGDSTDTSEVQTLAVVGDDLVAGGRFELADLQPASNVARFDGTGWRPLGAGTDGDVRAVIGFEDQTLVCGGSFTRAGGGSIPHLAGFQDPNWFPLRDDPVLLEDLAAEVDANSNVGLRWRLAPPAVATLSGIVVQRAPAAAGPFAARTVPALEPAADMRFAERYDAGEPWYRLVAIGLDGARAIAGPVELRDAGQVRGLVLHVPRDPGSGAPILIEYELAGAAPMRLDLYDVRGRLVRQLESGPGVQGRHLRSWDRRDAGGRAAAHGVYVLQLRAGGVAAARKLVLARP